MALLSQDGTKVAETTLKVTSPFRLGLVRDQAIQSNGAHKHNTTTRKKKH